MSGWPEGSSVVSSVSSDWADVDAVPVVTVLSVRTDIAKK